MDSDRKVDDVVSRDGNYCFTANGEVVHQVAHAQCGNQDLLREQLADVGRKPWAEESLVEKFKDLVTGQAAEK